MIFNDPEIEMSQVMKNSFLAQLSQREDPLDPPNGYYLHWENNVYGGMMPERFLQMFLAGDGSELLCKACAKHSSSMLAYNFFHWVSNDSPLTLFGKKFVDVAFEVKLPCLKRGSPANLDVALVGERGESVLFLESKFTEYFHNQAFSMSGSYHNSDCYANNSSWLSVVESVETLVKERMKTEKNYYEGIKQCVCHLIAIDRWRDCLEGNTLGKVSLSSDCCFDFATIVFEPKDKFKEHKAFERYRTLFGDFVKTVNNAKDIDYDLFWNPKSDDKLNPSGFLTYGNMWTQSEGAMPKPLREYLWEKYMKHSATPED